MKSTCPHCGATFRIDERKVPREGVHARCSRCGGVFEIQIPRDAAGIAPTIAPQPAVQHQVEEEYQEPLPELVSGRRPPDEPRGDELADHQEPLPELTAPSRSVELPDRSEEELQTEPLPELTAPPRATEPSEPPEAEPEPEPLPELTSHRTSADSAVIPELEGYPPELPALAPQAPAAPDRPAPPTPREPAPAVQMTGRGSSPLFGKPDPHGKARRLARALVSDIAVYNPERRDRGLSDGTLRQEFREEIRKSWDEYVAQVGESIARGTPYFREALNEILAGGRTLF